MANGKSHKKQILSWCKRMKRRFLLTTIYFILCGSICVAQNTVSQAEYEQWVDYVNCKRVVAFIDNKISQKSSDIGDKYKKEYKDKYKSKLNANLLDKVPQYKEIIKAIGDYSKAKMLSEYVNAKKSYFQQEWDKSQLINYLLDLPTDQPSTTGNGFKGYLSNTTNLLKEDLQKQIPDNIFPVKEKEVIAEQPKEEIKQTVEKSTSEIQHTFGYKTDTNTEQSTKSKKSFWSKYVWFCIIAVIVALIYRFRKELQRWFAQKLYSKASDTEKFEGEKELEPKKNRLLINVKQLESDNAKLRTENQQLKNDVHELEQQISELKSNQQQIPEAILQTGIITEVKAEDSEVRKSDSLYAANIIDGVFNKVSVLPNDYSVFELTLLSQSTASFTVYSNAYNRVLVAPEFIEGCEKQMLNDSPSNLEIEIGEARYNNGSGKWQIAKKAKINFI